jgi:outer membrane protein assembly factor BamA
MNFEYGDVVDRNKMEAKRDEIIFQLYNEGYTINQLSAIFNKHRINIMEILIKILEQ